MKQQAENEALIDFKNVVEERWRTARACAVQTSEGMEAIESTHTSNRLLCLENDQIKRDIQVLLDSYDAFKAESLQVQAK